MFDFTTTTFVHDPKMIEAYPGNNTTGTGGMLRIDNKLFKVEDVAAIYKNPYVPAANAKLKVDVEGFMTAVLGNKLKDNSDNPYKDSKSFKLDFYLKRSGDNNSFYSNDFVFKGKDFHYEWTRKHNTADKVCKMINKILKLYGDVYMKVYTEDDSELDRKVLVFENDNYGIFTEAELKVYVDGISDCCTYNEGGWETVDALLKEITDYCEAEECETPAIPYVDSAKNEEYFDNTKGLGGWLISYHGVNGFGTYEQILKDLRLPTMENFNWLSLNSTEMPVLGNLYTQYTFHQISCRGILGGSAVGEVTHSKTTHVFFVPSCGCGNNDMVTVMDAAILAAGMDNLEVDMTNAISADGAVKNPKDFENITYDASVKADTSTAVPASNNNELNNG